MYDFLFELTEHSPNEGEQILVECDTLEDAYRILSDNGFKPCEYEYIERMTVTEGEMLGLDTY